ncbi:aldose epimerase family protein [Heyndrickxia camelliae]|uniref:Aldose 1-epimerase n=1 Tax=Heyndrickxia camelliae TaxID=1707093 RepID=A0A2N3LGU6_9BACI|nr:aldose epimerase family protein [Heyndrickxia camelliae]PKR83785.1 galactose-1-epimerase [Heyndrickxia camelliae]
MDISKANFGILDGQEVIAFTLVNDSGMSVTCLNYGCIITKILVPDRYGKMENVVLGFDSVEEYLQHSPYFGAVVGRVAGRIKGASFELDGESFQLTANEHGNHIHGGIKGFSHVIWEAADFQEDGEIGIVLTYQSPDGEEGFPGELNVKVTYVLTNDNELRISYEAQSDQKTIVNLTNHSYFNLCGDLKEDILNHQLTMNSQAILELDEQLLPTGQVLDVEGTAFDFRESRLLKDGTFSTHPQNVLVGNGYDHPFVWNEQEERVITLVDPESGRSLRVETDQPSVVVYTSNQLEGDFHIAGVQARKYLGVCLETQGYPDAIHHSHFPSIVLEKGERYRSTTTYYFLAQ